MSNSDASSATVPHVALNAEPELSNEATAPAPAPMEQVRELLFGQEKRALHADIEQLQQRLHALEQQVSDNHQVLEIALEREALKAQERHNSAVISIGKGIEQLGRSIQDLVSR